MNGAALRRIRQHRKLPWLALLLFLQLLTAASPFAVYTVPHSLCIDSKEAVGSSGVPAGACILLPRKSPLQHAPEGSSTRRIPQCGAFSVDFEEAGAAPVKHTFRKTVGKTFATAPQTQAYTSTGANEVPGGPSVATPGIAAAADIENAFSEVVAAAEAALSSNFTSSSESRNSQDVSVSPWAASTSEAVEAARASFLAKVASAFGLKRISDASGVVYVHRSGTSNAKLLVDRQLLLRLRGEQQRGSWSLHFLGTGAMQASVGATRCQQLPASLLLEHHLQHFTSANALVSLQSYKVCEVLVLIGATTCAQPCFRCFLGRIKVHSSARCRYRFCFARLRRLAELPVSCFLAATVLLGSLIAEEDLPPLTLLLFVVETQQQEQQAMQLQKQIRTAD